MNAADRLRQRLKAGGIIAAPGAPDSLSARLVEQAGFEAIYMTGFGATASRLGRPDIGLLTQTEMTTHARDMARAVSIPIIADADTGYGGPANIARTIEEYAQAGVAAIHLEDQVAPKRCGHVAGREVIAREEAVLKIRAACQTRDALDPDFVIIARTDARGAHGGSMEEAITRANAFLEAGADLAFVEGPKDKEEVAHICQAVKGPVFYNMTGISPRFTAEEMAAIGIRACILPGAAMRATIMAIHDFATTLKAEGPMAEAAYDARFKQHPMGNLHGFAGFDRIREMEAEFLPAEAAEKYQGGLGYAPKAAE